MTTTDDSYLAIGPRASFERFLAEYDLTEGELGDRVRVRTPPTWLSGTVPPPEYLVHGSVLRPHGDFPCAGDDEALLFCEEIVEVMIRRYGISRGEAVARVNRQWSEADPGETVPRIWIVGLDIVYHEDAPFWAADIYYGPESRWWKGDQDLRPLPPP